MGAFTREGKNGVSNICAGASSIRWHGKQAHVATLATSILAGRRERSDRSSGGRRASATHVSADEYDLLGPGRKAAALLVCSKARPSAQRVGLRRAAQWNRVRVPGACWQFKSAGAPTASQHDHLRCIPRPHAFDSEGIRTPAGRAQWISSPFP